MPMSVSVEIKCCIKSTKVFTVMTGITHKTSCLDVILVTILDIILTCMYDCHVASYILSDIR